jgi:hypothetical protein
VRSDNPWGGAVLPPRPLPEAPPPRSSRIPQTARPAPAESGWGGVLNDMLTGRGGKREGALESMAKSAARSVGSTMGRQIGNAVLRGVLGSMLKR